MIIYLDESGDLGFDFENKKPSKFFVITLLALSEPKSVKVINKAVSKTLSNKLNHKNSRNRIISELKGSSTTLEIKKYFLSNLDKNSTDLRLYTIILDKLSLLTKLRSPIKDRVYNHMTHQLLEKIEFPSEKNINLVVDRSKDNLGIKEFNDYLYANLSLRLNLETKLYISHDNSEKHKCLQAVDMFCYGVARKYELGDQAWYSLFKDKIVVECNFEI